MPFDSFLGNAKAVATVREMLANHRVPGALLFSGPAGAGKRTLALMLGKGLNCERRPPRGDDFCGECARCRRIDVMVAAAREDLAVRREMKDAQRRVEGLTYFDVQLVEPLTRYILIEQIRQLRQAAYTRPFEFPWRVFVINQAQAIHWQAVDLLLKVLEEPPETTKIILVCPNRHELRPTIRSRCVHVQLFPVEPAVIRDLLAKEREMTKAQQALAERVAAGSIAAAKSFDIEGFERRRRPWISFLDGVAGRLTGSRQGTDWGAIFESSKALAEHRSEWDETLKVGASLLRDLLLLIEGGPDAEIVNLDLLSELKAWSGALGFAGVEKLKTGLDDAYRLQTRNVNQQLGLDALAAELLLPPAAAR